MGVDEGGQSGTTLHDSLRMRRILFQYTAISRYAANYFFIQYGLYLQYTAPLQYGFHLVFDYADESFGMSWHVIPTDVRLCVAVFRKTGTNNTHPL